MDLLTYVDMRCLQDRVARVRGIGQHVAALLRARARSPFANRKLIGLVEPRMPNLPDDCASWVDEISSSINPSCGDGPVLFIDGSPMTHDPLFSIRLQSHRAFFGAAVVYDYIPFDWPGYLGNAFSRIDYVGKMARLRKFDLFLPISEYTALRTSELLGVSRSRMSVTGASARSSLYQLRQQLGTVPSAYEFKEPYFSMVIASDPRKNAQVAVKAVRNLNLTYGRRIPLKLAGNYDASFKQKILAMAGHDEGAGFVEFYPEISDAGLVSLYAGAVGTIVSSHIEGFSLPVVEAAVCGCPAIASTCAAHMELVDQREALFQSDDPNELTSKLDALLHSPPLRDSLVRRQAPLSAAYHENAVGDRFWDAIEIALERRRMAPGIRRNSRPKIAFLSPYPPDGTIAAHYTAQTIRNGTNFFQSDLYSDAPRPLSGPGGFRDTGNVSKAPLISGDYNSIVSVLGNSPFHCSTLQVFEEYGGPCILHSPQLIRAQVNRYGASGFAHLAARLLCRTVSVDEVNGWVQNATPPPDLLQPIVQRASPLIVHTLTLQAQVKAQHGVNAHLVPSCPTLQFAKTDLSLPSRQAARERVGLSQGSFVVSSFGDPSRSEGMEISILAVDLLRSWNIPAEMHFVGQVGHAKSAIDKLAALYGLSYCVHYHSAAPADAYYRDLLLASDAAVQLRIDNCGEMSIDLSNCISAGLPSVASSELARSCDAPAFVANVPDRFSQLLVAEQLALIWDSRTEQARDDDERAAYLQTHNFEYYAARLLDILGLV